MYFFFQTPYFHRIFNSIFADFLSCTLSLFLHSQAARTEQSDQLRAALVDALDTRILDLKKIHPTTICATMCDPKFHTLSWCQHAPALGAHFKSVFLDELFKMHSARALSVSAFRSPAASESDVDASSSSSSNSVRGNGAAVRALPIADLFGNSRIGALGTFFDDFMDSGSNSAAASAPVDSQSKLRLAIAAQVERFISEVPKLPMVDRTSNLFNDSLDFWRENVKASFDPFHFITPMARRVLSVPASEAPSERVFSRLSFLIRSLRNRLSSDLVTDTMFLSCNRSYFASLPGGLTLRPDQVKFIQ